MKRSGTIEGEDLLDQKKRLVEEHGFNPEQAKELHRCTRKHLVLEAKDSEIDLREETVQRVTNVLIALRIKESMQNRARKRDLLTLRFLSLMCLGTVLYALMHGFFEGMEFIQMAILGVLFLVALRANISNYKI